MVWMSLPLCMGSQAGLMLSRSGICNDASASLQNMAVGHHALECAGKDRFTGGICPMDFDLVAAFEPATLATNKRADARRFETDLGAPRTTMGSLTASMARGIRRRR